MADEIRIERSDITIENEVATWNLQAEGTILGTYSGQFKFRCYLLPTQVIAIGREFRSLLGEFGLYANEQQTLFANALTQLKYRVISGPPFWTSSLQNGAFPGDIPDDSILGQILNAALDAELKYKQELLDRKKAAIERAKQAAERVLKQQQEDAENSPKIVEDEE